MNAAWKGWAIAWIHVALIGAVAGRYYVDRDRLPRVWAKAVPVDPSLPIRGRYVQLRVVVDAERDSRYGAYRYMKLAARDGRLVALPTERTDGELVYIPNDSTNPPEPARLEQPLAFFIPEHVPDPSLRNAGEELWVEVSVPPIGSPRPVRLGVKRDGPIVPLELR